METITPSNEDEHLCPVCLEEILSTDGQALTECCHNVFHLSCMILTYTQRAEHKTKCPMCRGNICKQLLLDTVPEQQSDTIDFASNLSSPIPWQHINVPTNASPYYIFGRLYDLSYTITEALYERCNKLSIIVAEKSSNNTSVYDMRFAHGGTFNINFIDDFNFYVMYYTDIRIIIRKFEIRYNFINPCDTITIDTLHRITHINASIARSNINKQLILNIDTHTPPNGEIIMVTKKIDIERFVELE